MFFRRVLVVGLLGLVILFAAFLIFRTNKNEIAGHARNQVVESVPTDQRDSSQVDGKSSSNKKQQKNISDNERIELAQRAVASVQFPLKVNEAEIKLKEELSFLYSLPASHERYFLIPALIEAYSRSVFENSSSKEELLDRMRRFGAIIKGSADAGDVERLLISASKQSAKMIGRLPSEEAGVLRDYIGTQGNVRDDQQMGARIIASCYVETMVGSEVPDASLIDGIGDAEVRMLTERTFLLTFDFGFGSEKVAEAFASRYLAAGSKIDSDQQIGMRLFGTGLQAHPEAVSAIILNAPPGQKRDEAIEQMIYRIAKSDSERSDLWLEAIQNPDIKERARTVMLRKRQFADPPTITADPSKNPFE